MNHKLNTLLLLLSLLIFDSCRKKTDDIKIFEKRIVSGSLDKVIISDTMQIISDTVEIDLNLDKITDFLFVYSINSPGSQSSFYMYAVGLNNNELLFNKLPAEYNYINALKASERFHGRWGTSYGDMVNPPLDIPWENNGPRYLGFRIKSNDKFYTGWLKMEMGKNGHKIIFYDYAFRLDNGATMYAGER